MAKKARKKTAAKPAAKKVAKKAVKKAAKPAVKKETVEMVEKAGTDLPEEKQAELKVGMTVEITGVAYYGNAPFDGKGERGVVANVLVGLEGDKVFVDVPARGQVWTPRRFVREVKK